MGYNFKDKIAIDVTSVPNYNGYATQLKSDGIKYVQYIGAYQYAVKLKSAFYQSAATTRSSSWTRRRTTRATSPRARR